LPTDPFHDADDRGTLRIVSVEFDVGLAARTVFESALSAALSAIVVPEGCAAERVFTLTKMDRVLNVFHTIERAANALTYAGD